MNTIEKQKKNIIARRAVYALILLVLSVLQNTQGFFPEILGARALPLIPAVVCIAMNERDLPGLAFGLFAGALWDISASGNSFNALLLMTVGFLCGTLINTVMRNNIVTASILTAAVLLIYNVGYWFFKFVITGYGSAVQVLLFRYLPGAAYSLALLPLMFFGMRAVENAFREE